MIINSCSSSRFNSRSPKLLGQSGIALFELLLILGAVVVILPVIVFGILPKVQAFNDSERIIAGYEAVTADSYLVQELSYEGFPQELGGGGNVLPKLTALATRLQLLSKPAPGELFCSVTYRFSVSAGVVDAGTFSNAADKDTNNCAGSGGSGVPASLVAQLRNSIPTSVDGDYYALGTFIVQNNGNNLFDHHRINSSVEGVLH